MSVFVLECSDKISSEREGGVERGSDLNVQLTLSGGKVNMSTQAAQTHIAREGCNVFYIP